VSIRPVKRLAKSKPTLEGAGVHLRRAFGFGKTSDFDPFLLLDDFRNDIPEDYLAGFPWHPHRGIETITYVLAGEVEHGDSMGNRGSIGSGDVQWMTAGSGIIHQEMPKGDSAGRMHGFQLWANLPAALKMTAPRYQEVKAGDIPLVVDDDGTQVRIICGDFWGTKGPVDGIVEWSHPPLLLITDRDSVPCLPIVLDGLIETTVNCISVTLSQLSSSFVDLAWSDARRICFCDGGLSKVAIDRHQDVDPILNVCAKV